MNANYQLIVRVPDGIIVRDRPAPQSRGAIKMRAEPVGKVLSAFTIINIEGVDYAGLIPQNPLKPEWVRVAEADRSIVYVDVIPVSDAGNDDIAAALNRIAAALEGLKK